MDSEDDLKLFEDYFGIPLPNPINVRKQVLLNSCYFLLSWSVGGWVVGWLGGWLSGGWAEIELKITQFNFNLNCLFKLSLAINLAYARRINQRNIRRIHKSKKYTS